MEVSVYFNSRKHCFSVKLRGKVIYHATQLVMSDVRFSVNENARQKVIFTQRKSAHAFVSGTIETLFEPLSLKGAREVKYNPYRNNCFYDALTLEPVYAAKLVLLKNRKVYILED